MFQFAKHLIENQKHHIKTCLANRRRETHFCSLVLKFQNFFVLFCFLFISLSLMYYICIFDNYIFELYEAWINIQLLIKILFQKSESV